MVVFSLCSASLLVVNKAAVIAFHAPAFITCAQFVTSTVFVLGLKWSSCAEVDDFEWVKVRMYLAYVGMFVGSIYSNMKALQLSNVETLIVFRACTPIVVSGLEWAFLGRQLPSGRSCASLIMLVVGAAGYVASDKEYRLNGWAAYWWVSVYFGIISIEMAYGKVLVSPSLKLKSMWSPTLFTNSLSIFPMAMTGILTHEEVALRRAPWAAGHVGLLALSCAIGIGISYAGWACRNVVTATCYTVVGVTNKMLTVLVNALVWDKHASPVGTCCLVVCLVAAVRPSPTSRHAARQRSSAWCNRGSLAAMRAHTHTMRWFPPLSACVVAMADPVRTGSDAGAAVVFATAPRFRG